MWKIKTLDEIITEAKKGFSGSADSLKAFMKIINKLPDTIESVKVPIDLNAFNSKSKKIEPTKGWKKEVEKILKKTLKMKGGKDIDTFSLNSFYGDGSSTDPYFIRLSSDSTRGFEDDMRSGKHGKLD